jgi:hypothetical protein
MAAPLAAVSTDGSSFSATFITPFGESWDSLEGEQQRAALLLGYEAASWPKLVKEWPDWDGLSPEEQAAAGALELDEDSWPPKQDVFALDWADLDERQQSASAVLGFSAAAWPSCGRDWPAWEDLSEQAAAETLGLDQFLWPPDLEDDTPEFLFDIAEMAEEDLAERHAHDEPEPEAGGGADEVIAQYRKVVLAESAGTWRSRDEWGFRALARIVKLCAQLGRYEDMLAAHSELLDFLQVIAVCKKMAGRHLSDTIRLLAAAGPRAVDRAMLLAFSSSTAIALRDASMQQLQMEVAVGFAKILRDRSEDVEAPEEQRLQDLMGTQQVLDDAAISSSSLMAPVPIALSQELYALQIFLCKRLNSNDGVKLRTLYVNRPTSRTMAGQHAQPPPFASTDLLAVSSTSFKAVIEHFDAEMHAFDPFAESFFGIGIGAECIEKICSMAVADGGALFGAHLQGLLMLLFVFTAPTRQVLSITLCRSVCSSQSSSSAGPSATV